MRAIAPALTVLALLVPAAGGAQPAAPVTLVETPGPIYAFAQDGGRLAWIRQVPGGAAFPHAAVYVAAARPAAAAVRLTPRAVSGGAFGLSLGRERALWWSEIEGHNVERVLETAAVGDRRPARLGGVLVRDPCGEGNTVDRVAADGSSLAYSLHSFRVDDIETCNGVATGSAYRVVGRRARRIPGVGLLDHLSLSGTTLAGVAPSGEVELRHLVTGALRASVKPEGRAVGLALAPTHLGVLTRTGATSALELRRASTGELLRTLSVGRGATSLAASGAAVVYAVGRDLYAVDSRTLRTRRLTRAASAPIGLSIEGRRVAWAENVRGRGRIRALVLP